jgi:hypothetical protein
MNAGMVRMGGILAFVLLALFVVMIAFGSSLATNRVLGIILGLILYAIIVFVFWTTKGLFNSHNYRSADIPILGIIVMIVISFLLSLIGGGGMGAMMSPGTMGAGGASVLAIIGLLIMLLWFGLWLWFGIKSMGYSAFGGGLWKAIGILYLIGTGLLLLFIVLLILALVATSQGLAALAGILALIGVLVTIAAWICHGIGLITGAGKMQAA